MNALLLPNLTLHAPTPADVPEVIDLLAASDQVDYGEPFHHEPEDVIGWWKREETTLVRDAGGRLIAYFSFVPDEPTRYYCDVFVHPDLRGQGLEGAIIERIEAGVRERTADAPTDQPVTLDCGMSRREALMRGVLAEHGFGYLRTFWRMRIDQTEPPPAPEWPTGIALRTYQPGTADERAVYDAVETAFEDHWNWHGTPFDEWLERTQKPTFDPTLWFLAMDGDQIAGATLCIKEPDKGWVSKVAVPRAYRQRGIAKALLYQAFGTFWERGVHRVELGVDSESLTGAQKLYERVGMRPSAEIDIYQKVLREATGAEAEPEPRMQEL